MIKTGVWQHRYDKPSSPVDLSYPIVRLITSVPFFYLYYHNNHHVILFRGLMGSSQSNNNIPESNNVAPREQFTIVDGSDSVAPRVQFTIVDGSEIFIDPEVANAILSPQDFVQLLWTVPPPNNWVLRNAAQFVVKQGQGDLSEKQCFHTLVNRLSQLLHHSMAVQDIPESYTTLILDNLSIWFQKEGQKEEYQNLPLWPPLFCRIKALLTLQLG